MLLMKFALFGTGFISVLRLMVLISSHFIFVPGLSMEEVSGVKPPVDITRVG